jgi:hypothetical protein
MFHFACTTVCSCVYGFRSLRLSCFHSRGIAWTAESTMQNRSSPYSKSKRYTNITSIFIPFLLSYCNMWHHIRSQWPCGHELSSPAQTLGSWVRIALKAWLLVCAFILFVLSYVQAAALRRADPPSKESYRVIRRRNWKSAKVQQRTVQP